MKYLILVVLLAGVLFLGPKVKKAECLDCAELIGKSCFSDFVCMPAFCNLSCVKIDQAGFQKICR